VLCHPASLGEYFRTFRKNVLPQFSWENWIENEKLSFNFSTKNLLSVLAEIQTDRQNDFNTPFAGIFYCLFLGVRLCSCESWASNRSIVRDDE